MASLSRNPPQGFDKAIEACNNLPEDLLVDMVRLKVSTEGNSGQALHVVLLSGPAVPRCYGVLD